MQVADRRDGRHPGQPDAHDGRLRGGGRLQFWPAVLVHDYRGPLIIVAWLFAFWAFAHRWILGTAPSNGVVVLA
jgi:hypothetical protein